MAPLPLPGKERCVSSFVDFLTLIVCSIAAAAVGVALGGAASTGSAVSSAGPMANAHTNPLHEQPMNAGVNPLFG